MMNYELHHIVKFLQSASENVKIDVIPKNDKKLIVLSYGVCIKTRKRKRGEVAVLQIQSRSTRTMEANAIP